MPSSSTLKNSTDIIAIHGGLRKDQGYGKLFKMICQYFPHIPIVSLPRKYFNDDLGKSYIVDYGLKEDAAGLIAGLSNK